MGLILTIISETAYIFSCFLLVAPLLLLWQAVFCKVKEPIKYILLAAFIGYLLAVFQVTGLPTFHSIEPNLILNLNPFNLINTQTYLNIVLFIPLGLLLPLLWKTFRRVFNILLAGLGLSLMIELLQILTITRYTDIDDLIMNTFGTIIGFVLARLFLLLFRKKTAVSKERHGTGWGNFLFVVFVCLLFWMCDFQFIA